MEVCIPFLGSPDQVIMLFQRGAGYNQSPNGPSCPFIAKEPEEPVPLLEIEKTLKLLEVSADVFWDIQDHTEAASAPKPEVAIQAPSLEVKPKPQK
jgi:hypothetical protein